MIVYAIFFYDYEGPFLQCICSSLEKAEKAMEKIKLNHSDDDEFGIEEITVDECV